MFDTAPLSELCMNLNKRMKSLPVVSLLFSLVGLLVFVKFQVPPIILSQHNCHYAVTYVQLLVARQPGCFQPFDQLCKKGSEQYLFVL